MRASYATGVGSRHAGAPKATVFMGVPHPDFGEVGIAVVVRKPEATNLTEADMIAALKQQIAGYKVPKRVFFITELPRNTMGKVQKNLLRERYADLSA